MQTIQLQTKVGADGILSLTVPLGEADANSEVLVTIRTALDAPREPRLRAWRETVDHAYGSCSSLGLERPDQGTHELREELK